jgi:Zn-finger nucleic acid-binding protein
MRLPVAGFWIKTGGVNAETLNCPMCGAPASSDSTVCEHCGARLATVACPSCFGLMFRGAKFCSHCGARADRVEVEGGEHELCPRCRIPLKAVMVGSTNLEECPKCEGIWADTTTFDQICADREKQATVLGMATPLPESEGKLEETIRYIPCPVCQKLMNRVNFANCSHVIVDVCKGHGTWLDRDELRRIVEFIRAGGLEAARAKQISELQDEQRRLSAEKAANATWDGPAWGGPTEPRVPAPLDLGVGIETVAQLLKGFLK